MPRTTDGWPDRDIVTKIILREGDDDGMYVIDTEGVDGSMDEFARYETLGAAIAFGWQEARRWGVPFVAVNAAGVETPVKD